MTCQKAQSLITKYANNQLDIDTLEEFLLHINHCADCKEELEVYYTVFIAMQQLDEDTNTPFDFKKAFHQSLKRSEEWIVKEKIHYIRRRVNFLILLFCVTIFSNLSLTTYEKNQVIRYRVEGDSVYELPIYFYETKSNTIDTILKEEYGIDLYDEENDDSDELENLQEKLNDKNRK